LFSYSGDEFKEACGSYGREKKRMHNLMGKHDGKRSLGRRRVDQWIIINK
jgi:hypothetical protein